MLPGCRKTFSECRGILPRRGRGTFCSTYALRPASYNHHFHVLRSLTSTSARRRTSRRFLGADQRGHGTEPTLVPIQGRDPQQLRPVLQGPPSKRLFHPAAMEVGLAPGGRLLLGSDEQTVSGTPNRPARRVSSALLRMAGG